MSLCIFTYPSLGKEEARLTKKGPRQKNVLLSIEKPYGLDGKKPKIYKIYPSQF